MKKIYQEGFAAIEAILLIVIVALVAGVGFFVWNKSQTSSQVSQAESSTKPQNVFRMGVYYYTGKLAYYDWAVGKPAADEMVDEGNGFIKNEGAAFRGYSSKYNGETNTTGREVYNMRKTGGGARENLPEGHNSVVSIIYTTDSKIKNTLEQAYDFRNFSPDAEKTSFRAYKSKRAGTTPVYRLWAPVTVDDRRLYIYTDSKAEKTAYKRLGYTEDGIAFYAPNKNINEVVDFDRIHFGFKLKHPVVWPNLHCNIVNPDFDKSSNIKALLLSPENKALDCSVASGDANAKKGRITVAQYKDTSDSIFTKDWKNKNITKTQAHRSLKHRKVTIHNKQYLRVEIVWSGKKDDGSTGGRYKAGTKTVQYTYRSEDRENVVQATYREGTKDKNYLKQFEEMVKTIEVRTIQT